MITSSTNWRSPYYDLHRVREITGGHLSMKITTDEYIIDKLEASLSLPTYD